MEGKLRALTMPRGRNMTGDTGASAWKGPGVVFQIVKVGTVVETRAETLTMDAGPDGIEEAVWVKESFQLGYADYHWQHESCLYGWRKRHHFYGERNQSTVWEVRRESEGMHLTRKPVELFVRPIRNNLRRGELALDMFLGSGTAIIAAEELGAVVTGWR